MHVDPGEVFDPRSGTHSHSPQARQPEYLGIEWSAPRVVAVMLIAMGLGFAYYEETDKTIAMLAFALVLWTTAG